MYVLPTEPMTASGMLDAAYRLFRASFQSVLLLSVVLTAICYLPLAGMTGSLATEDPLALISLVFSPSFIAACVALTLLCIVVCAAMLVRMEAFARGVPMTTSAAVAATRRKLPQIIVASVLFLVAVAIGSIVIVPGLILMQSLMFYLPAIALDGKSAADSLGYSHRLVWGFWWRTAAIWGFGLLIATLAVYFAAAFGIVVAILPIDLSMVSIIEILAQALVTVVITPFMVALWLELYRDLKLRKAAA